MVELIGATTTKTGMKDESALDTRSYQKGTQQGMKRLDITGDQFHPEWNSRSGRASRQNRSSYCSGYPNGTVAQQLARRHKGLRTSGGLLLDQQRLGHALDGDGQARPAAQSLA